MQGGIALAADTRATAGTVVADKNCEKIHKLAPNIFCCGAGTAADCEHVTGKCANFSALIADRLRFLVINQVLFLYHRDGQT